MNLVLVPLQYQEATDGELLTGLGWYKINRYKLLSTCAKLRITPLSSQFPSGGVLLHVLAGKKGQECGVCNLHFQEIQASGYGGKLLSA